MPTSHLTHPGAARVSLARPAIALAAAAAIVGLTLGHPSSSRMLTWPWVLLTAALWVLPVIALLWRLAVAAEFRLPNGAASTGLILLAVSTVVSASISPFSDASLARTWPTLAGVAFVFLLHDWLARNENGGHDLVRVVAWAGTFIAAVSCTSWVATAAPALWANRNAYPFGHSNYTAGFIVLLSPWLVVQACVCTGRARVAWTAAIALTLFTLAGTSSRGAAIALLIMAAVTTLVLVQRTAWSRGRKWLLLAGLIAVGSVAVLTNPRLRELVRHRRWGESAAESNRQRAAMLSAGRLLGAERPWLGWGPGTVPLAYPRVRAQLDGGVDNVLELHSTPAQIWATLGLAGAVAAGALVVGLVLAVRRSRRDVVRAGAIVSLGGYALFSLTEHQLDLPAMTGLVAIDFALLVAADSHTINLRPGSRALIAVVGLIVGAAPAVALRRDVHARGIYSAALDELEDGRTAEAVTTFDDATRIAPYDPYFQHQAAGIVLGELATVRDPQRRAQLSRDAITRLESSLRTGVHQEFADFNLGWLYLEAGDGPAAARHFIAAAHLVPDKGGVYFGLGLALQAAGRRDAAVRAFALEWIDDPRSMTSPAWEIPSLAALRPAIRTEMSRLYAEVTPSFPSAAIASAWARWWGGESISPDALGHGFNASAADFVAALPAIATHRPVAATDAWATLYHAWREKRFANASIVADPAIAAALSRRAQRHGDDFIAFLRAGSEDEPALIRTYRRGRTGYGVLALHPDGPVLNDAYIVQENVVITDFAAALFPPKGWLPGKFLLAWLPALSPSIGLRTSNAPDQGLAKGPADP